MGERATLTALGNVKFDVLRHIHGRKDIEIVKLETRYMKKREKGAGLKVTIVLQGCPWSLDMGGIAT